jgi:hypothetical protein
MARVMPFMHAMMHPRVMPFMHAIMHRPSSVAIDRRLETVRSADCISFEGRGKL